MSFTSHIVRVGEGWDSGQTPEEASSKIYSIHNDAATAAGSEGSSDDSKELFPDTYVDMAKAVNEEIESEDENRKRGLFFRRRRKMQKSKK